MDGTASYTFAIDTISGMVEFLRTDIQQAMSELQNLRAEKGLTAIEIRSAERKLELVDYEVSLLRDLLVVLKRNVMEKALQDIVQKAIPAQREEKEKT